MTLLSRRLPTLILLAGLCGCAAEVPSSEDPAGEKSAEAYAVRQRGWQCHANRDYECLNSMLLDTIAKAQRFGLSRTGDTLRRFRACDASYMDFTLDDPALREELEDRLLEAYAHVEAAIPGNRAATHEAVIEREVVIPWAYDDLQYTVGNQPVTVRVEVSAEPLSCLLRTCKRRWRARFSASIGARWTNVPVDETQVVYFPEAWTRMLSEAGSGVRFCRDFLMRGYFGDPRWWVPGEGRFSYVTDAADDVGSASPWGEAEDPRALFVGALRQRLFQ